MNKSDLVKTANNRNRGVFGRVEISATGPARLLELPMRGITILAVFCIAQAVPAEDWPTYGHDNRRSGVTAENLAASDLAEVWTYVPNAPPQPGFPHPMTRDTYNFGPNQPIKPRVLFDRVSHVAAVGDAVFFATSADDSVYCLGAATGKERWSFTTEGPVRAAPACSGSKVYFGSDDGWIYCLRAETGEPVWKRRPAPTDYRVPSDGKLISLWPVRTGVLVAGGVAYCCAGLFPSETVYVCAYDAESGESVWQASRTDFSPQGHLLASEVQLYVTAGRSTPVAFSRSNGKYLGKFGGGGGAWVLVTDDRQLIYGPGRSKGELGVFGAASREHFATFDGNHILVTPKLSYLHTDTELAALDRTTYLGLLQERSRLADRRRKMRGELKKLAKNPASEKAKDLTAELETIKTRLGEIASEIEKCMPWTRACKHPYSLILAADILFAGGDDEVAAYETGEGNIAWSAPVDGKVYGLAAANGRLFASTGTGKIYCFAPTVNARRNTNGE